MPVNLALVSSTTMPFKLMTNFFFGRVRSPPSGRGGTTRSPFREARRGATGCFHEFDELGEIVRVNSTRVRLIVGGDPSRLADDFTHHAASAHDADRSEGATIDGNTASGHEEVVDVFGIHGAVRDGVAVLAVDLAVMNGDGDEGVILGGAF